VEHNLQVLNPRYVTTCEHPRGTSIVDLVIGNRILSSNLPDCSIGNIIVGSDHKWLIVGISGQRERDLQLKLNKITPQRTYKEIKYGCIVPL